MHTEGKEKKRGRFRRVSKARIFDGQPLRPGAYAVTVMVLAYLFITAAISLLFSYFHEVDFSLVLWTLLPGALLGYVLLVAERTLGRLKESMFLHVGKFLTAFLLFVSYPLGYVIDKFSNMSGMAGQFSLFSVNFFIILAILSWLRNMRTEPCRCL
jgi:hypothetical protein